MNTFFPIANLTTTIKVLLALASIYSWHLQQLYVNNTFLHEDLDKKIYILPLLRMVVFKTGQVCKLTKSLYSLKQTST